MGIEHKGRVVYCRVLSFPRSCSIMVGVLMGHGRAEATSTTRRLWHWAGVRLAATRMRARSSSEYDELSKQYIFLLLSVISDALLDQLPCKPSQRSWCCGKNIHQPIPLPPGHPIPVELAGYLTAKFRPIWEFHWRKGECAGHHIRPPIVVWIVAPKQSRLINAKI